MSTVSAEKDDAVSQLSKLRASLTAAQGEINAHKTRLAALAETEQALAELQIAKTEQDKALSDANTAVQDVGKEG